MEKKIHVVINGCFIILTIVVFIAIIFFCSNYVYKSPLYLAVSSYCEGQEWVFSSDATFADDSGEKIFLRGMNAFDKKDYVMAKELFEQALDANGHDPALPAYLYFYINQCDYYLSGNGNLETVSLALNAIRQYPLLCENADMVSDLVSSIMHVNGETDEKIIELLQEHIESTENMQLIVRVRLKNMMGMLEYINNEYAKAILQFYDVELELENVQMTPKLVSELAYAKEFIANICFTFHLYEEAASRYQEVIDFASYEGNFNAYGSYINTASAYLEIPDIKKAKECLKELEKLLPYAEADILPELEACVNDVRANICIAEGNYDEADKYLDEAEAYYQNNEGKLFLDGESFIKLTRCKYMYHTGAMYDAQMILEEMVTGRGNLYNDTEQSIYELLKEIYQSTGQDEKLLQTYQILLDMDEEFSKTREREYLSFARYYGENRQLKQHNENLLYRKVAAEVGVIVILGMLIVVLILFGLLNKNNVTDQLTKVYNRKKFARLLRKYQYTGTPANLCVVMMDIDYFKQYNDTYGHPAGDKALKEVAKVLVNSAQRKDTIIRYGGEEFLVLLNEVQLRTAETICHQIQEMLRKLAIPHSASKTSEYVTLSMGLCYQTLPKIASLEQMIKYADECLYQSKKAGRNYITTKVL